MHETTRPEVLPQRWPRPLRVGVGLYLLLGGVASFLGWVLNLPRLTDWVGRGISIQPNATICVALTGMALLLLAENHRRLGALVGLVVAAVGGLTLIEWVFHADLGFDTVLLFGRDWVWRVSPGRMGPQGSLAWTLTGLALVFSGFGGPKLRSTASKLGLLTFSLGLLSLTGHLYDVDALYTLPRVSVMAFQTATFIVAAAVGTVASHEDHAPMRWLVNEGAVGIVARRSVPAVILAPICLGWVHLLATRAGWYGTSFGTSLLVLALIGLLGVVLYRGLVVIARHEAALLASEERMQLAIDAGGAATWDLDLRSGRNIWSDSHFRLWGIATTESHETTPAMWQAAVLSEDLEAVQAEWRRARAAGDVFRAEYRLCRPDGSMRWARSAGRFFYDARGRATRFVGVLFDVTDEKQVLETLHQADRRKNEFLAILAHELRNPLAAVRNAVRVIKGHRTPDQQWALEVIERQTGQMTRLVDDLLDVSRISHGTIELQREVIGLDSVVRAAVEASRPLLDKHGHELTILLPQEPVTLNADLARLTQVFCNLLDNSAKYTPGGGKITLAATRGSHDVSISVRDNGLGMPAEMLPHVFDMFTQVDRLLEQSKTGLGIGLTLVKRLVELHGGRVEARSAGVGKGSEFIVTLPTLEQTAPVRSPEETRSEPSYAGKPNLRPTHRGYSRAVPYSADNAREQTSGEHRT
jgi:PAS domain S-box-containing protein